MDKLTLEAVANHDQPTEDQARAHAERYPVKPGAPAGWWVAVDDGYLRLIALSPWSVGAYPGYTDWRPCDQRGTPVRPDGSDTPGDPQTKAGQIQAAVDAFEAGRQAGRAAERAAIVAGVEGIRDNMRSDLAWMPMGYGHALRRSEQAVTEILGRLKAGEWSAKP